MEIKKSKEADIERRRPLIFAASLMGVVLVFVGILFIPFKSISEWTEQFFDDYAMDLDLLQKPEDDMISAALPQRKKEEKPKDVTEIKKVEDANVQPPEELIAPPEEQKEENPLEEEVEEEPPINLNGDDPEKLKIVEQLPQYPGGMVEFMKWLTATLKYPKEALDKKIQGQVSVSFIVNTDGTVSDIKVSKPAHVLLNNEALRVARLMPKWEPGIEDGKPCRTMMVIPVVFEI